jgi:hypothetical protein
MEIKCWQAKLAKKLNNKHKKYESNSASESGQFLYIDIFIVENIKMLVLNKLQPN